MKMCVIGGGGVRSMFLAKSLIQRAGELHINEVIFMDNNEQKLCIYGEMAKQVAKRIDPAVKFILTTDAVTAVMDADYVITTIRVGEDEKRVDDEKLALNLGLLGQETTGAAGFSFAMRSIPALVKYCELIRKYAKPEVKVFNFTNPAGLVSQALRDLGYDFTYGICDAPSGMLHAIAKLYGESQENIRGECYGLNHLSFFESIQLNQREIMPELIAGDRMYEQTDMRFFEKKLVSRLGQIPNEYLYYYLYREKAIANIAKSATTRGTVIRDINRRMTEELSDMDISGDFDHCLKVFEKWHGMREGSYMQNETGSGAHKPPFRLDIFEKDAGGYAGVALKYIEMEQSGKPSQMILCVPNNGAIPGLLDSDVIEATCTITPTGCTPHPVHDPGEIPMMYIRQMKLYERLAAGAICTSDKALAVDALTVHPLVSSYSLAGKLVDGFIESNRNYIEGWN